MKFERKKKQRKVSFLNCVAVKQNGHQSKIIFVNKTSIATLLLLHVIRIYTVLVIFLLFFI